MPTTNSHAQANADTPAFPLRGAWLVAIVFSLLVLTFAAYTRHAWEDYLITFRASRNLALTGQFVFQDGERIQTYTSPLGTLVPAVFALGGGEGVEDRALWGLRLVSIGLLALSVFWIAREFSASKLGKFACMGSLGLLLLDAKTTDFSINGMETAFAVFFLVLLWKALNRGLPILAGGLAIAGLQWTRPDGFIFSAALLGAWWLLSTTQDLQQGMCLLKRILKACALGILCYLPWVLFVWFYYGTPIPHTITAKQGLLVHEGGLLGALFLYPWRLLQGEAAIQEIYLPAYWFFGGWPGFLRAFSVLLATGGMLTAFIPSVPKAGRLVSLALLVGGLYVEVIPRSPWYFPVWQLLGFVSWAYLLNWACACEQLSAVRGKVLGSAVRILALLMLVVQLATYVSVAYQMRSQQRLIEQGHRMQLALWLKTQAHPGDRVYLEPLGYIGYYSDLKMLDNPGLASREVVKARHSGHETHAKIITLLKPEWLVLRPDQIETIRAEKGALLEGSYEAVRIFDTRAEIDALKILPGRGYLNFDSIFVVFKKK